MALDYIKRRLLVDEPKFRDKLQVAMWIASCDILTELDTTPNHAKRLAWANKQLKGPADPDKMLVVAVRASANSVIGPAGIEASDSDVQFVVNGLVNELAA